MSMNHNKCNSSGQICRSNASVASSAAHHSHSTEAELTNDAEPNLTVAASKGRDVMANEEILKDGSTELDCAICLQTCVHPVRLPCAHVFCFLCAKGAADRSHRCALCRQVVPPGYVLQPQLLPFRTTASAPTDIHWYYEGVNGWWQYDERASAELEQAHEKKEPSVDLLIAGHVYIVDFERMVQVRRTDPTRRRRVKRDRADIVDKKGIAGLKLGASRHLSSDREPTGSLHQQSELNDAENSISTDTPSRQEDRDALSGLEAELSSLSLVTDSDASPLPVSAVSSPLYDGQQDVNEPSSSDSDWE